MSQRLIPLFMLVLALPGMLYGLLQYWPTAVSTAVTLGVAGLVVASYQLILRRRQRAVSDPVGEARMAAALDRIGLEYLTPRVIDGQGQVIVQIAGGYAAMSLKADELLTDAELDALLLQESAAQPALVRLGLWRYVPWLLLIVMPVGWALSAGRRATARDQIQAYSQRGGSQAHLISGLSKTLRAASGNQSRYTARMREMERLMDAITKK